MLKPTDKRNLGGGGLRFVAAESLLLSGLLLLGAYVVWDTGFTLEVGAPSWVERADSLMLLFIPWQPVLAVSLGLTTYWTLQALGRVAIAFWLMTLAATVPHGVPAWTHNRIGWQELFGPAGWSGR